MTTATRAQIVQAINTLHDAGVLGYRCINDSTVTDIKNDEGRYIRSIYIGDFQFHTRLSVVYNNMKSRCKVGGAIQRNQPYYANTTMCDEWLGVDGFDNFAEWCQHQIGFYQEDRGQLFELDKDLLGGDSKHYSPDTCTMLPNAVNVAIKGKAKRGYVEVSGKFKAQITKYGVLQHIGTFDTAKEATKAYRKARRAYIRELAEKYRHQLSIAAYDGLMSFKQA